ncbi:MAG TPA: ubiquitin-like domain-containing protein [Candidatus Binatia bacterium]|nr:ubiquitin-like domain-containing protein [Candidatus Binatia bacterium]
MALIAVAIIATVAAAGYLAAQDQYTIYLEGTAYRVDGNFETVGDVVAAAGLELRPEDRVQPPLEAAASPEVAIEVERAKPVTLRNESGTRTLWTLQPTLAGFIAEAAISVDRADEIWADGSPVDFHELEKAELPSVLEIGKFKSITVEDGADTQTLRTAVQTVGEALDEAGITIYAADGVEPSPGTWLRSDLKIVVRRSIPLTVHVDGRVIQTRSHHRNAADVLAEMGIGLVGQDYVRPGPETILQPGAVVEVVRVTEDFRIEDEPIPYETRYQGSDQLELDSRALLQSGVPGVLRRRTRMRYENGAAVGETPDGEWVAREPVDEIIGYGTNIVVRSVETPAGYYEYWRVVRMRVTSYTAASSGKPPDHPTYGITASGLRAGTGIVAVDPTVVPFRSWVYVPGYGTGYAGDTGGGVKGRWIDLGYSQGEYQSWSGYVDVYYLTPVPDPEDINYLIPTWLP